MVKYWSSSARLVSPDGGVDNCVHAVLMSVKTPEAPERTVRIATCISGAVSKRIAEILQKEEGTK